MSKKQMCQQPPKHGRVISSGAKHSMPVKGLKAHLAQLDVARARSGPVMRVRGHGSRRGRLRGAARSGAQYQTTSVGDTGAQR